MFTTCQRISTVWDCVLVVEPMQKTIMKKDNSLVVSVVAPLRNDAEILPLFLEELLGVLDANFSLYEIVLIDDGSTDETPRQIDRLLQRYDRVRYLRFSKSFGREVAIAAGLETAIGDFVVILIPDTDPVSLLPDLVAKCRLSSGLVCGVSLSSRHRGWIMNKAARAFHAYCRRHLGFDYKENSTDYRVLSRQVVNAITRVKDRHRYLRIITATLGYNQEFFSYELLHRKKNTEEDRLLDQLNNAIEIVIANSRHPLRIVSRLGLLLSVLNFLYLFYVVAIYFFKSKVAEGWTTASLQHTTMFFFVFLILSMLCEYVGRILEETQDRPLYVVSQEKTSSVVLEDSITKNIINDPKEEKQFP